MFSFFLFKLSICFNEFVTDTRILNISLFKLSILFLFSSKDFFIDVMFGCSSQECSIISIAIIKIEINITICNMS